MVPSVLEAPYWSPPPILTALTLMFLDTYYGSSETSMLKLLAAVVYDTFPEGLVAI